MDPVYWSIILIVLGFFVILIELFIPSAGALGILAAVLLISGVIVGFTQSLAVGATMLLVTALMLPILFGLMIKIWPHTPIGRRILIGPITKDDVMPQGEELDEMRSLVGRLGVARTKMLPSGMIMIDDKKFDAVSDGLPIDQGQTIKVVSVKAHRITVTPYEGSIDDEGTIPVRDNDVLSQPIEDLGIEPLEDLLDG